METLENNPLYRFLLSIKPHPWVFLGKKSLNALDDYIAGYLSACMDFDPECFTVRWLKEFDQFAAEVCKVQQADLTVFRAIRLCGYSDSDGLMYYFALLDRFAREKYCLTGQEKPTASLRRGEIRAFRLEQPMVIDLVGKYLRAHAQEYFGISDPGEGSSFVFSLSRNNILTCALCGDDARGKLHALQNEVEQLPTFSTQDSIQYTTLSI